MKKQSRLSLPKFISCKWCGEKFDHLQDRRKKFCCCYCSKKSKARDRKLYEKLRSKTPHRIEYMREYRKRYKKRC